MLEYILFVLILIILILFMMYSRKASKYEQMQKDYQQLATSKQSMSTKYGKMTEQFMPFTALYPYDKNNFRFLGSPIDGIQFNDKEIVFVEFKTNKSRLSDKQKHIQKLVSDKKVRFEEFRI